MNNFSTLLEYWSARRGEPLALATVVRTQGSTYRRPGARMLIDASGAVCGLVSGGCLESDVAQHARRVLRNGEAKLLHYDTRLLFGCNGELEILIEALPIEESENFLVSARASLEKRQTLIAATIFKAANNALPGSCALSSQNGNLLSAPLPEDLLAQGRAMLADNSSQPRWYRSTDGQTEALLHAVPPPLQLFVFGTGPDMVPVCAFARQLGWRVNAIIRPSQQAPALPPDCEISFAAPEAIPSFITPDARTAAIVMTHNYGRDLACLSQLLSLHLPYVGLLGPRQRREQLLCDLTELGNAPEIASLANLYSPAGLDIGADGPEEIALSILSEIKSVLGGRAGGSLRDRAGTIHARPATDNAL